MPVPNDPVSQGNFELVSCLRELTSVTRGLAEIAKEQLEYARRAEERFNQQHQMVRGEFQRWLEESDDLRGYCRQAEETVRQVLGRAIHDLVDFVRENEDNLRESDFTRSEMIDRYGAMLHHVSVIHTVLKRMAAVENAQEEDASAGPVV